MKSLSHPQVDNIALWERIVSRKRQPAKEILQSIRDKVKDRYGFYESHINALHEIQPLHATEWNGVKHELQSCYGQNIEFTKVRQAIFDNLATTNQTKCPYCMINRPNTLDHYFDKNEYPEFSVYVPNLVPCCSECNSQKGTYLFDGQGKREYIHFYHDTIPEKQFLFVRYSFSDPEGIPVIDVRLRLEPDDGISPLIQTHFCKLSLLEKYKKAIKDNTAPIIEEIQMYLQNGLSMITIRELLQIQHNARVKSFGNNYWESCVYEGILNSPGFLDKIAKESVEYSSKEHVI